jgi:hypothetical protein
MCSACFNQQPDEIHVDFEAAYDGPVIDQSSGIKMTVDDLYLCADCVRAAYRLLDDEGFQSQIQVLQEELAAAQAKSRMMAQRLNAIQALGSPASEIPEPVMEALTG